jgi:hypothetical protein
MIQILLFCLMLQFGNNCRYCDRIERNHVYRNGEYTFTQIICWEWNVEVNEYEVIGWFMETTPPEKQGRWCYITYQNKKFFSRIYKESWTMFDPEVEDRKKLPMNNRKGLN